MADDDVRAQRTGHEPDQPTLRGIAIGAGSIVGAVVVAVVVGFLIVRTLPHDEVASKPGSPPPITGGPVLQATPERDFPAFHAEKQRLLDDYGWVDRAHGIARIPIERAMALLVAQQARTQGTR